MNFSVFKNEESDIEDLIEELGMLQDVRLAEREPKLKLKVLENLLSKISKLPYENITKHISDNLPSPSDVLQGYKMWGTGATCFPLVYIFKRILDMAGIDSFVLLADRNHSPASHTLLASEIEGKIYLLDVGFSVFVPVELSSGTTTVKLPQGNLLFSVSGNTVEVYTIFPNNHKKFRYKAEIRPVNKDVFVDAWKKTYEFEMMNHVVVVKLVGNTLFYIRDDFVHLIKNGVSKNMKMEEEEVLKIIDIIGIDRNIFLRAWHSLLNRNL